MGLLDNFDMFPDDPRRQAMLMWGAGLLGQSGHGGRGIGGALRDLGNSAQGAMGFYQNALENQQKMATQKLQQKLMGYQLNQAQRQDTQQAAMDQLPPQFFSSGKSPVPNDDNGNPMPQVGPPKADWGGYANALAGIDPMKAVQFQQALLKENAFGKVDAKDYTPESVKAFMQSGGRDYSALVPVRKKEAVGLGGVTALIDPYAANQQVIPHTLGPGEAQRLGMEGARLAMEKGRYNYEVGNGLGLPQKIIDQIGFDVGKKKAEAQTQAQLDLPQVTADAQQTLGLIDKLVNHPGFSGTVGAKSIPGAFAAAGHPIPGTDTADWMALKDQLLGKQFMQAYQSLKGGGQITEVEGKKATDAIARMGTAQSENSFKEAAKDFRSVIEAGLARSRARAGAPVQMPQSAQAEQSAPKVMFKADYDKLPSGATYTDAMGNLRRKR